jgi:hypothetical protein
VARAYVVPGLVVVVADLEVILACPKLLLALAAHVGLGVDFLVLQGHLHRDVFSEILG